MARERRMPHTPLPVHQHTRAGSLLARQGARCIVAAHTPARPPPWHVQIVKGTYTPVPATRSRELRDLIDRIFTLNWEKRPSINDILATPVVKARITKFLSATLHVSGALGAGGTPCSGQL